MIELSHKKIDSKNSHIKLFKVNKGAYFIMIDAAKEPVKYIKKNTDTYENPCINVVFPLILTKKLDYVDWNVKDVLVGSLGSVDQLHHNIAEKYYYVPAKHISKNNLPVKYVAICQSSTQFGNHSGIRYYGEITSTSLVPRKEINFPLRRNNGEDMYYLFRISEWKTLTVPVDIRYEAVYKPRFTNLFLLEHCTHSYELFCIESAEQFLMLRQLNQFFGSTSNSSDPLYESAIQFKNGRSLYTHNGYVDVFDENGNRMFDTPFKTTDYSKDPKRMFLLLSQKLI